MFVAD
jgi:hypothetical protein